MTRDVTQIAARRRSLQCLQKFTAASKRGTEYITSQRTVTITSLMLPRSHRSSARAALEDNSSETVFSQAVKLPNEIILRCMTRARRIFDLFL
jgi:hypothetical protein